MGLWRFAIVGAVALAEACNSQQIHWWTTKMDTYMETPNIPQPWFIPDATG